MLSLALLGLFSLGASCNHGKEQPGSEAASEAKSDSPKGKIESLDKVDTSMLTAAEKRTFVEVTNEVLSPCGEPVSVAQCVAEARACNACVPSARYVSRLVAEGYGKPEIVELYGARFDPKKKRTIDVSDSPVRGAPMATVSIVEFSDFECPHCGAAHPVLARTLDEFSGKVNLVFKQFPLDSHKNAAPAARAAVAAQQQGKFWELADLLFEHQRELSAEKIEELAKRAGVDLPKFNEARESHDVWQRVEKDKKEGVELGVQGTPSLFINGRAYKEGLQGLSKYLKEELEL
ncbi:MAG TPA: thioredoxin domain-containing protein [Polyangiales bacterium]|nr:thioredoxin domain-containing protein [Polyangiales bacterium]